MYVFFNLQMNFDNDNENDNPRCNEGCLEEREKVGLGNLDLVCSSVIRASASVVV